MSLKDKVEVFALALECGLKTVPEVIAWSDENIVQLETPPIWLLELQSKSNSSSFCLTVRQTKTSAARTAH